MRPERKNLKQHTEEGEDERQEDEGLVGILPGAGQERGSVDGALVPVVVLGREDEGCQPAECTLVRLLWEKGAGGEHTGKRR